MSRFIDCPCNEESPDPCPKCGATVKGDDAVHGVCQAGAGWDRATAAERKRCTDIINAARFGEIDQDFRAIGHMIEGGLTVEQLKR